MRFKQYYKDILSLIASLSLLAMVYFINHYDIKQMYREFATLSLKVDSQEKQIEKLMSEVKEYKKLYSSLQVELEEHNETRGVENALLLEKLQDLEYKVEVLSMKSTITKNSNVFNDRFENDLILSICFISKQTDYEGQRLKIVLPKFRFFAILVDFTFITIK